jgi:predicted DNA-binding protein
MLSVRLPESLEKRLAEYCETMNVSKSYAVQIALEKHLKKAAI